MNLGNNAAARLQIAKFWDGHDRGHYPDRPGKGGQNGQHWQRP
jgi:hypothetical protein